MPVMLVDRSNKSFQKLPSGVIASNVLWRTVLDLSFWALCFHMEEGQFVRGEC